MAPSKGLSLSEDEIDDLVYLARTGEDAELAEMLGGLAGREGATPAEVLEAARDDGQATCLHMAAANGHSKGEEEGKPPGESSSEPEPPYIDARNSFGNTALHWACLGGHLDVVQLLLSRGARPAAANDKDQIPLDLAAFNSHMHVVEHFLAQSRDIEGGNAEDGVVEGVKDFGMGEGEGA